MLEIQMKIFKVTVKKHKDNSIGLVLWENETI